MHGSASGARKESLRSSIRGILWQLKSIKHDLSIVPKIPPRIQRPSFTTTMEKDRSWLNFVEDWYCRKNAMVISSGYGPKSMKMKNEVVVIDNVEA